VGQQGVVGPAVLQGDKDAGVHGFPSGG
jgi:hypothetical protein